MSYYLLKLFSIISELHEKILGLNDAYEYNFTDKQLHFIVIGLLGMCLIFTIYPIFRYLAKHNHEMVITWIYVFTVLVVITFAIEIGQRITGTGSMEFWDIIYGLAGFIAMFAVFAVVRNIFRYIIKIFSKKS